MNILSSGSEIKFYKGHKRQLDTSSPSLNDIYNKINIIEFKYIHDLSIAMGKTNSSLIDKQSQLDELKASLSTIKKVGVTLATVIILLLLAVMLPMIKSYLPKCTARTNSKPKPEDST